MQVPQRIALGNLPTRIEKLENVSSAYKDIDIYIKRDDYTGMEWSGNKVRKLEYVLHEVLEQGCDCIITCGGIQSNHARATAALAAKLNLKSYLVLKGTACEGGNGNHYLDLLFGADIRFITAQEYAESRNEIMDGLKSQLESEGLKPYIIPEGASDGLGNFGYLSAYQEIKNQEEALGIEFDVIAVAVGSGSTYGGLLMGAEMSRDTRRIFGLNIYDSQVDFKEKVWKLILKSGPYLDAQTECTKEKIEIINDYVGLGYGKSTECELKFIRDLARKEGLVLDPVYTGKAFRGLIKEIESGRFDGVSNILFIHTGGIFGGFPNKALLDLCES